jgi:hypothetical protein
MKVNEREEPEDRNPKFDQALSSDELLKWVFKCRKDSKPYCDDIHEEVGKMWDIAAGEGLSENDRQVLRDSHRPEIDPPFAAGVIDAVMGMEIAANVTPRWKGVDSSFEDSVIADWLSLFTENGFMKTGADEEMLEAYHDDLVGGYGFVEWFLDTRKVPFRVVPNHLNFWDTWWDHTSVKENLIDMRYIAVEREWPREEADGTWAAEWQRAAIARAIGGNRSAGSSPLPRSAAPSTAKALDETVTVIGFQYRRGVKRVRYVDPETGEETDATLAEYEELKGQLNQRADELEAEYEEQIQAWTETAMSPDPAALEMAGPEPQEPSVVRIDEEWESENCHFYNGYAYRRAMVVGDDAKSGTILEDKELDLPMPGNEPGFTIKPVTGYAWRQREKKRVRRYGLMKKICHIQDWFTKFLRQYLELQSRKIKGGGLAEARAFEGVPGGFEAFVKKSAAGGHWQRVADGTIEGNWVKEWGQVSGEPGLLEGVNLMRELFGWVTGVTQGLQGTLTSDRANILVENQQEHGLQMLLPIRQPRRAFLLSCARTFAAISLRHLPAEEIDRVLGVQVVEGMTHQRVVGPDGRPQIGPDGKPVLQPMPSKDVGPDGQPLPLTAGRILKQVNLLEFDLEADIVAQKETDKVKFMTAWQQHGLGAIIQAALPGPGGTKIWIGELFRNMMPNAATGKQMAAKAEAFLTQQEQQESAQGMVEALQQMMATDPEQAQQLLQELTQIVSGAQAAAQPEAA